jgi:hypothetical protein
MVALIEACMMDIGYYIRIRWWFDDDDFNIIGYSLYFRLSEECLVVMLFPSFCVSVCHIFQLDNPLKAGL